MKHIIILIFSIISFEAVTQHYGEIKIDLATIYYKEFGLAYEMGLTRKGAVELRLEYEVENYTLIDTSGRFLDEYPHDLLTVQLGYKFYFGQDKNYNYSGFSVTPFIGYRKAIAPPKEYVNGYKEIYEVKPYEMDAYPYIGASALVKGRYKRWVLEGGLTHTFGFYKSTLQNNFQSSINYTQGLYVSLRVGYALFIKDEANGG